jgi:hypothetical protein
MPNPTDGSVLITQNATEADLIINITDTHGALVFSSKATGKAFTIDLSQLATGLYFVTMRNTNNDNVLLQSKLIKQ